MVRFLARFIGLWLLAGAFVSLVIDGNRSIASGRFMLTAFGEAWYALHPASLDLARNWIEAHLPAWLWNPVILGVLLTPLWIVLAVFGAILVLVGRKRERPIGYSSRD
jgi:ABC-type Fe3+ transport system permease subunit